MSLLDYKITDQSVQGVYVQSQPDRLTGTPQQNKEAFDAYPALIRKQFNLLVDALGGTTAAGEIPIQSINGVQAQNVQQALAAIQQNLTAYINKLKATTGAAEVGVSTISGISAGNVQKALEGLRTIQITLDSNIKKLMSANGAATVGVNKISGMQAQNVQKALEELRKAIDDSVSGIIPGGSITADMIVDNAIVQLGALLAVAAAAEYNPEGSYAVGDYCTQGGKLYKCRTPIESGEAWNVSHWLLINIGTELANRIPNSAQSIPSADCNAITKAGNYQVSNGTENAFQGAIGGIVFAMPWDINRQQQIAFNPSGTRMAHRAKVAGGWGSWIPVSNAVSPQTRNLTLKSGFSANGDCTFFVTQESTVFLAGGVSGTLPANQDTQIGTLPADVRPAAQRRRPAVTNAGAAYIDIHTDGTVWAHPFVAASQCWFVAPFAAGGGS